MARERVRRPSLHRTLALVMLVAHAEPVCPSMHKLYDGGRSVRRLSQPVHPRHPPGTRLPIDLTGREQCTANSSKPRSFGSSFTTGWTASSACAFAASTTDEPTSKTSYVPSLLAVLFAQMLTSLLHPRRRSYDCSALDLGPDLPDALDTDVVQVILSAPRAAGRYTDGDRDRVGVMQSATSHTNARASQVPETTVHVIRARPHCQARSSGRRGRSCKTLTTLPGFIRQAPRSQIGTINLRAR